MSRYPLHDNAELQKQNFSIETIKKNLKLNKLPS